MKRVIVAFDYEGGWGMPYDGPYDIAVTTDRILTVLKRHKALAVFFVTGKLVEEYPDVIRRIHEHGHEIAFHGYTHEHMHAMTAEQLASLVASLRVTSDLCESLIGYRPRGFRAPYLMGPSFYDAAVYQALADEGFTWVSNREIRWPEELYRSDRMPAIKPIMKLTRSYKAVLLLLNASLVVTESHRTGIPMRHVLSWLLGERAPLTRLGGITEYPLYSPLDRDILALGGPDTPSGAAATAFATQVLKDRFDGAGEYFSLNCHDWIIGTSDRLAILDDTLAYISADPDTTYHRPLFDGVAQ